MKRRDRPRLPEEVKRRKERRERFAKEGDRPLAANLALAGTIGWLIVVPALVGIWIGKRLDRLFDTGILFTAAGVFAGVVLGAYLGYRRVREA